MSEQLCLPEALVNPCIEPDHIIDAAAGDAPGCCDLPSAAATEPPCLTDKPSLPGLEPSDVAVRMMSSAGNTPSSPARGVRNLDGGWAWVIMVAALFTHILTFGMSYSTLGVFFVDLLEEFGGTTAETSWMGSIMLGMMLCTGPFISIFIDKFGACAVAVVGGAFASAGFFLSAMATSLLHLYFSFGVLAGLGFGMAYLPCIVMLGRFFEKKRAFATGVAGSGSGLGTFIFAPLNQFLLETIGWRQSMIVLGGVELVLCLCGAVYLERKLPVRVVDPAGRDTSGGDSMGLAGDETSTPSLLIVSRAGAATSMQSLNSIRTNGAVQDNIPVGSWRQSIGAKMGRCALIQSPPNGTGPTSPFLLDSFFGLTSPVVGSNLGREFSTMSPSSVGESCSQVPPSTSVPVPTIEITRAPGPSPPPSSMNQSDFDVDFSVGSWQQSVNVRAGLGSFLQSPITSPTADSPFTFDNISRLSVPSAQEESSLGRSSPGSQTTITALDPVPEENRLYPQLDGLAEHDEAISARSVEDVSIQDPVDENQRQVNGKSTPCMKVPRTCNNVVGLVETIASLFRNRFFVLFWMSGFVLCIGYQLPYMYFKAFALSRGIEDDAAAVILAVMGITDMLGRLVVGFVFDRSMCVSHRLFGYVVSLLTSGVLLVIMATASTLSNLAVTAATYTLVAGSTDPLVPALLVEYVGLDSLCYSFGLIVEMQGFGFLVGPPLAGYVYEFINDYSCVYIVGAIAFSSSGCILLLEPLIEQIQRWRERRRHDNHVQSSPEMAKLAA